MAIEEKHDKRKGKIRKEYRHIRDIKTRALETPPVNKMILTPEKKKNIWELLADRERNIHSGDNR